MSIAAQGTKGAPTTQSGALWELHVKLCLAGRELILGNVPGGAWRQTKEIGTHLRRGGVARAESGRGGNKCQSEQQDSAVPGSSHRLEAVSHAVHSWCETMFRGTCVLRFPRPCASAFGLEPELGNFFFLTSKNAHNLGVPWWASG